MHKVLTNGCVIRDATFDDLPQIVEIYNATVPTRMVTADLETTTVEKWKSYFDEHSPEKWAWWVFERDNRIDGWLSFSPFNTRPAYDVTAVIGIYIHEWARRQGIATSLIQAAIELAPTLGFDRLAGLLFADNEPSRKLLVRNGFVQWGYLPGVAVLDGVRRDALIYGYEVSTSSTSSTS